MANGVLADFYREYVERVVNDQDMSAVDDMVSPSYVGSGQGWPESIEDLREFYSRQIRMRPNWRIEIQETVEVGEWVAVRAFAGGQEADDEHGTPQTSPIISSVEWLALVRVVDRMIMEIRLMSLVSQSEA